MVLTEQIFCERFWGSDEPGAKGYLANRPAGFGGTASLASCGEYHQDYIEGANRQQMTMIVNAKFVAFNRYGHRVSKAASCRPWPSPEC